MNLSFQNDMQELQSTPQYFFTLHCLVYENKHLSGTTIYFLVCMEEWMLVSAAHLS